MTRSLLVKATAGTDAPERCSQAFTVAATACAAGVETSLWLTGESVWLAVPGRAEQFALPYSVPMAELVSQILGAGRLTVCTQCARRRDLTQADLLPGVAIAGAAAFVAEATAPDVQALVY